MLSKMPLMKGSSPRVRSRPNVRHKIDATTGIISACAEQTLRSSCQRLQPADHLRVCGADAVFVVGSPVFMGSSPRVRSRRKQTETKRIRLRIISACAEQTIWTPRLINRASDHLRVCGADDQIGAAAHAGGGSSPRVRSRRLCRRGQGVAAGIISACAEQTANLPPHALSTMDHLRVCGAD